MENKNSSKLFFRENVINDIYELIGNPEETFPQAIYICGVSSTGKTTVINRIIASLKVKKVVLNCIECYNSKLFYEAIIFEFGERKNQNVLHCETLMEFVSKLSKLREDLSYIVVLENAERLRDMEVNILPVFLRLQELTGLNICCILISQLPFEKYYVKTGLLDVIQITCPQFSKNEVLNILSQDFASVQKSLLKKLQMSSHLSQLEIEKKRKKILTLAPEFYCNFLDLFLSAFFKICREISELRIMSTKCFLLYIQPVLDDSVKLNDVSRLWRNIISPLRIALSSVYTRTDNFDELAFGEQYNDDLKARNIAQSLDLPYYAKYLLIASFLASHNSAKDDKRLYMKNHGKQKKRMQTENTKLKTSEKMSTSLGPKSFSVDRLLAIFYAILEKKIGLTCNLLSQISTLVNLKLLCFASGQNNIMEGSARLQCTVGLDFILCVGKSVGFNVRQYICDFN